MPVDAELLTPTLQAHRPRDWRTSLPFRVSSQVYVGFFGGPVAATLVALVNARRLRLGRGAIALAVLAGVLLTFAGVVAAARIDGDVAPRLFVQLAGVLSYGVMYLLQRSADRVHAAYAPHDPDESYASLWGPGIAAIVAGWLVQAPLIVALEGL